jgi:tetratricopeptide (TPR) repeat protein
VIESRADHVPPTGCVDRTASVDRADPVSRADHEFAQALAAIEAEHATPLEKLEMLVEMALGLQQKPKSASQLHDAVTLYDLALERCPASEPLLSARIRLRKASALHAIPEPGPRYLLQARAELESVLPALSALGAMPEEVAEAEMALGVVVQSLAGLHAAKIGDAISAYQRATRVFDRQRYPRDFAILQNNLATAYLSLAVGDERAKLREALAVQAFSEALEVVSLVDDPIEYAMLQNNLGNALQYAATGHAVQNCLRALEAYDEALKVRTPRDTPVQYANTIANKANCLRNLPDDERSRSREALALYAEASAIFRAHGELEKADLVEQASAEIARELGEDPGPRPAPEPDFGESRI